MRHTRTFGRFTTAVAAASLEESSAAVLRAEHYDSAFSLTANAPLTLDDPDTLWIVASGEVDLFHVRQSSDAYLANRRYVGTLWAGEVVAGARPSAETGDGVLVAVGYGGASLQAVPRNVVDLATGEGARIARAIANGVAETIGRAMHRASRATARALDLSERTVTLPPHTAITAAADVIWFRLESGELSLGGEIVVRPGPQFIPLARGMWFNVGDSEAKLSLLDTFTAFASKRIADALEHCWSIFLAWLTRRAELDDTSERARLGRKIDGERARHAAALASLTALLQGRGDAPPVEPHGEALIDACAAIGAAAGISFRAAPPAAGRAHRVDPIDPHRDAVMAICNASRVRYRRVALRGNWWTSDAAPLLGFRGAAFEPVALLASPQGQYRMRDPATASERVVTPDIAASLSPLAYTFYVPAPAGAMTLRVVGRMLAREVWPDFRRVLAFVAAGAALGLALPIVTGMMFNDVIPSAAMGNAFTLFVALVAVAVATSSVEIARAFALIRVEGKSNHLLQSAIVDRLLALPPQFFRKYSVGDLALRAEAVNAARQALTGVALTSLFGGALVVTSVFLMAWYSVKLAVVALGVLAVSAGFTALVGLYALPYERRRQTLMGSIGTLVFEILSGIAKLHVAAAERRMFALWGAQFRELKVVAFRAGIAAAALAVFNTMLPILASAAVFIVAAKVFTVPGSLSTGSFIAFNAAFVGALAAGIGVSTTLVSVLNVIPLFERASPILSTAPEVDEAKPDVGAISGRIEMSNVTFGYIAGAPPIIDDVSLNIRPGEFVAFVGPSGGGKSTILRLLLGFERPDRGAVYFDGHDLASIDVSSVRRQSAVVLQHSKLLAGDIFTNIVGASPLTHDDAWRAAELAGLADDIRAMPMGMFTVISEGGSTLSGGQRQRLLIARALVRNPRVVFFDEATSALDNRSQDIVTRSLEEMEATRIVIAHRLTTVQRADRIFVMQRGRIVQEGRYDDLVATPGLFKDLAERQLV
jgi:NHLM bacteriocin system ABC transporter ATP-binding protein